MEEGGRGIDGAIDVGFGGEMDDEVGLEVVDMRRERRVVEVELAELVGRMMLEIVERIVLGGVSESVEVADGELGLGEEKTDQIGTDKTASARYQKSHRELLRRGYRMTLFSVIQGVRFE